MRLWIVVLLLASTGCEKKPRAAEPENQPVAAPAAPPTIDPVEVPAPAPARAPTRAPADVQAPLPENPGTSLRIRTEMVRGASGKPVDAMCRADEQLTGGVCSHYNGGDGFAIDARMLAIKTDGHTFGAGWRCVVDKPVTATAFCLSDSASPRPPVEK